MIGVFACEGMTTLKLSPHELERARCIAVGTAIDRSTAALYKKMSCGTEEVFTGVFVTVQARPFLVTAAHCLREGRPWQSFVLLGGNLKETRFPPRLRRGRSFNDVDSPLDIGFMELDPHFAESLDADWVGEERMSSRTARPGSLLCIRGYPTQATRPEAGDPPRLVRGPMAYATRVVRTPKWCHSRRRPKDPKIHLEFDSGRCFDLRSGLPAHQPNPKGMSGSGAFGLGSLVRGRIWSPGRVDLVGILSGWVDSASATLRVVPIEYVLRLIHDFCSECSQPAGQPSAGQ